MLFSTTVQFISYLDALNQAATDDSVTIVAFTGDGDYLIFGFILL